MEEIDLQTVRVGTSGYQFADWYGSVYPEKLKQRDVLEYYSHVLGLASVEINYTYYRLPSARTSAAMAQKVPDEFSFTVRSYSEMTHEIWADRERKVLKDTGEIFDRFIEGIAPLEEAGKLGSVLLQFPYSFWPNRTTFDYLRFCQEKLVDLDVVIEFRNRGWMRESTVSFLREKNLGYCVVDEPKLKGLHPFVPMATSGVGYIRLHGRNPAWFEASKDDRYDYLYSDEELDEIVEAVKKVGRDTGKTYVFFNNCAKGQAMRNALMLKKMLGLLEEFNAGQKFALGAASNRRP